MTDKAGKMDKTTFEVGATYEGHVPNIMKMAALSMAYCKRHW
jgi:hypothetical protein